MKYLFGDSTPFPMEENFLDTACAASEAAVALLRASEVRLEERRMVEEADQRAQEELAHFDKLARRVVETYAEPSDELRSHMGQASRTMMNEMRAEITKWREAAIVHALETAALSKVVPSIGRFFEKHQLPGTHWSLAWRARLDGTGAGVAQVHGQAPGGLDVSLDVAIPVAHAWSKPQRVSVLSTGVAIHLVKKRVLRQPRVELESLDALFVTEVIDLPGEWTMTLRKSQKKPSQGLRVVLSREGTQEVSVARIAEDGSRLSDPEVMRPEDALVLQKLFGLVGAALRTLVPYRSKLRAAYFRDASVTELEDPASIGELIVESVAPYVREIARRSNGRDELALKRTLGDGRREELFVPFATVLAGLGSLDQEHRELFDAYGLGRQAAVHAVPVSSRPPMLVAQAVPQLPESQRPVLEQSTQMVARQMTPPPPALAHSSAFPPPMTSPPPLPLPAAARSVPPPRPPTHPAEITGPRMIADRHSSDPSSLANMAVTQVVDPSIAAKSALPPAKLPPATLPPAKLPPAKLPPARAPGRAPMPSDAFDTQQRPIFRIANA